MVTGHPFPDLTDTENTNEQQVNLLSLFGLTRKHEQALTYEYALNIPDI
jgi:hypothetical protein